MTYLILGLVKIIDNLIMTLKSLATIKGKAILSSVLVGISSMMYYIIIKQVLSDDSIMTITVVSVASAYGNYLAFRILNRFKKDSRWNIHITASRKEFILSLSEYLTSHNIKHLTYLGLTRKMEDTYHIKIYSFTKTQSKLVDEFLSQTDVKYLRIDDKDM